MWYNMRLMTDRNAISPLLPEMGVAENKTASDAGKRGLPPLLRAVEDSVARDNGHRRQMPSLFAMHRAMGRVRRVERLMGSSARRYRRLRMREMPRECCPESAHRKDAILREIGVMEALEEDRKQALLVCGINPDQSRSPRGESSAETD